MSQRTLEAWEATVMELKPVDEQLAKYYNNKIALRYNKVTDLEKTKRALHKKLKDTCPHDQVVVQRGTYTDVGYGCDRYYTHHDLYCKRCSTYLLQRTDGGGRDLTDPVPLFDAVQFYHSKEPLSDDELLRLGVQRHVHTTHTFKWSQT